MFSQHRQRVWFAHTLFNLVDVDNPNEIVSDDKATKNIRCSECTCVQFSMFQLICGTLLCFDCVLKQCDRSEMCLDRRLEKMVYHIEVRCHLQKKGCKWKGNLETYPEHLLTECDFAQIVCGRCNEIVHVKNATVHKESDRCKNHDTTEIQCPLDCGYRSQRWFMEIHNFDKCPKSKQIPLLEEHDCTEHDDKDRTEHVSREHERFLVSFHQKCNDTFEMKINEMDFRNDKIMLLQNVIPVKLWMVIDCFSECLNVHIASCQNTLTHSTFETLKRTMVTLTLVNKKKTRPDHETRDYKTIIPFDTSRSEDDLFSKFNVIKTKNMLSNSETNTCYCQNNECEIKIDFRFPNKLTNFKFE